jgi:hypothetical protein
LWAGVLPGSQENCPFWTRSYPILKVPSRLPSATVSEPAVDDGDSAPSSSLLHAVASSPIIARSAISARANFQSTLVIVPPGVE